MIDGYARIFEWRRYAPLKIEPETLTLLSFRHIQSSLIALMSNWVCLFPSYLPPPPPP
jgi:hypothetical protein